jgi:hypothetical protein
MRELNPLDQEDAMKVRWIISGIMTVLLPILGCEESSPTKNSNKVIWKISDFTGTYQLLHYSVMYEDNTGFSEETPDVTITGEMTISEKGAVLQTFNFSQSLYGRLNYEDTASRSDVIAGVKSDSILVMAHGGENNDVYYRYNKVDLTFRFNNVNPEGLGYVLTETWKRISVTVKAKRGRSEWPGMESPVFPAFGSRIK